MPKITKNFTAERTTHDHSVRTQLKYRTPEMEFGRDWIDVTSNKSWSGDTWGPAKVNWSALGSVTAEEAAEFAKALEWASREAVRIDKANLKLKEKSGDGHV